MRCYNEEAENGQCAGNVLLSLDFKEVRGLLAALESAPAMSVSGKKMEPRHRKILTALHTLLYEQAALPGGK